MAPVPAARRREVERAAKEEAKLELKRVEERAPVRGRLGMVEKGEVGTSEEKEEVRANDKEGPKLNRNTFWDRVVDTDGGDLAKSDVSAIHCVREVGVARKRNPDETSNFVPKKLPTAVT